MLQSQGGDRIPAADPLRRKNHPMTARTADISPSADHDTRLRLWDMIKDIRFAMFTARHAGGHLHSRPMTTQNKDLDTDTSLWFFMSKGSDPVLDIAGNPEVNISYADVGADSYVSVSGCAAVVEDLAKKQQLWSKMAEAWFPGGPDDPDLALVEVRISHAAYWDVKESKLVQLYKMARAAVTGERPEGMGEHAEVQLR